MLLEAADYRERIEAYATMPYGSTLVPMFAAHDRFCVDMDTPADYQSVIARVEGRTPRADP